MSRKQRRRLRERKRLLAVAEGALVSECLLLVALTAVVQVLLLVPSVRVRLSMVDSQEGLALADETWGLGWLGLSRGTIMVSPVVGGDSAAVVMVNGKPRAEVGVSGRVALQVGDLDLVTARGGWLLVTGTPGNIMSPRPGQIITEAGFRVRIVRKKEETGQ
ncbi:MAG: hypothetical protein ACPLPR_04145 [Bacillota bacterium]